MLVRQNKIPDCLPIQRGIHLCNPNFVNTFKSSYMPDSSVLAEMI